MMNFAGLKIVESPYALEESNERLFPASKNRSKRIHKKLVKRHGGEFRKVPCMFRLLNTLFVHPAVMPELRRQIEATP